MPRAADSSPGDLASGLLMLAFDGFELPDAMRERLARASAAGITLFRFLNVSSAAQTRALTDDIQRSARQPLLIAADQEGGQFLALGDDSTPFAGNMALGAVGDEVLAERVGRAIGLEARAMGVNVVYAPCLDLATDPRNPSIGIRSFGADPGAVSGLAAAWIRGIRSAGVAATAKHFPGKGAVTQDSHHMLPVLDLPRSMVSERELAPFRASIAAGADFVMSAHVAMTAFSGDATLPATLDPAVMTELLRDELGFDGLTISDALDMRALPQGPEQAIDAVAAMRAGIDLLLLTPDPDAQARVETAVRHAAARALLERGALERSTERLARLRGWLAGFDQPGIEVVGSTEHRALARELAERSVTLVHDDAGLLPLALEPDARLLAVMPQPRDLTPADTSSRVAPELGAAIRGCHPRSDEFVTSHPPSDAEIAEARRRAADSDVIVVGTISASFDPQQVALVEAIRSTGRPLVTVALRTPFDLAAYPAASTHVATYSILRPSLDALASALFGAIPFQGRLPRVIDLQVNGAAGHDLTEDPASLWAVGEALTQFGVTAFVPTLVSPSPAVVSRAQDVLAGGPPGGYEGAQPLGWHVEGPFISPRRAGAHAQASLALPSLEAVGGWSVESGIRIVTMAPELPGALPVIEALAARGIVVSIGHTDATYEQARAAIDAGARFATHLFNAMAPLNHREPGPAAAVLEDERVTIGLIVDGLHLHPAVVRLIWRLAGGPDGRVAVVSDAMAALGMPPGRYRLAGREVDVGPEGARVDGVLAGCVVGLSEAVASLARFTGATEAAAGAAATVVPRRLLGLES